MKKLLNANKKVLLAVIVAAIVALSAGTYAWFTQNIAGTAKNAQMGRLHIDVESTSDLEAVYEPGQNVLLDYLFKNPANFGGTQTIDGLVRVALNGGTVDFWADADGNPIEGPKNQPIDPQHVSLTIDEQSMPAFAYNKDGTDIAYIWLKTPGEKPTYYLWINSGEQASIEANVKFDGPSMGNVYQGALFHFPSSFLAGQLVEVTDDNNVVTESSVHDTFGVYLHELVYIDGKIPPSPQGSRITTRSLTSDALPQTAAQAYQWLLDKASGK